MYIQTNRLILRSFTTKDIQDVYEYSKNPRVSNPAAYKAHDSIEYTARIVNKFIEQDEIAIEYEGHVIGSIGNFNPVKREYSGREISYSLKEEYWGMGIMQEALNAALPYIFKAYNTQRIYCCNYMQNLASRKTCEALGFQYLEDYLYTDTPDQIPRMVRYYELRWDELYYFKYDFTPDDYSSFRDDVGFPKLSLEQIQGIVRNSAYKLSIYNKDELIGMARCITDDSYLYLLCDVMISSKHQGKGIGYRLVSHFIKYLRHKIGKQYARVYIMSLKGKEEFYKKLGFKQDYATGLTIEFNGDDNYGNERKEN